MNRLDKLLALIAIMAAGSGVTGGLLAASLTPLTDNQSPPYVGVWAYGNTSDADAYAKWLGRQAIWAHFNPPQINKTWAELDAKLAIDPAWGAWATAVPGRRVLISVPLLPADGSTLALGATGAYNAHFAQLAANLVANHLGNTILCFGPTNGWGLPWRMGQADDANFILYWKQIVTTIRAVPGADKIQFDWIGDGGPKYNFIQAFPEDNLVDYIGTTASETNGGDRRIYPYPVDPSASERLYHNKLAWKAELPNLVFWRDFAKKHGKPLSIVLWGMGADHTSSTGEDVPYFIQQMHDFITDPDNNVYFTTYFDNYDFGLFRTPNFPNSSAKYRELFGLAPATPPPPENK